MATYSTGSIRINAVQGVGTVPADSYSIVTYILSGFTGGFTMGDASITRYFGPGESVPATIVVTDSAGTATYSLASGVQFQSN